MIDRVEHCTQKATNASGGGNDECSAARVEVTKRWREMADQTEAIDRVVADKRKPRQTDIVDPRPPVTLGHRERLN